MPLIPTSPQQGPDNDDLFFRARMTEVQFRALGRRIDTTNSVAEIKASSRFTRAKKSSRCDLDIVRQWLRNGWNTERILAESSAVLEGASGAALQWTFPQAYYAAFAQTLAFFQVAGFTEESHIAVKRKFAELAAKGQFPSSFGFAADGTKNNMTFHGLTPSNDDVSALHFDPNDTGSCDRQIQQFLRSTRQKELKRQLEHLKLKTKSGTPRKRFDEVHWRQASHDIKRTGLLCLLYRKRIKSNYRDIDTFTAASLDPTLIYDALSKIVNEVALVCEAFIASAVGFDTYKQLADDFLNRVGSEALRGRVEIVEDMLST